MNDASKADIRIIDTTTSGSVIHCGPNVEVTNYEDEIEILTDDQRYVVNDAQLNALSESYTVATDY
jgi:hypothetical protein